MAGKVALARSASPRCGRRELSILEAVAAGVSPPPTRREMLLMPWSPPISSRRGVRRGRRRLRRRTAGSGLL